MRLVAMLVLLMPTLSYGLGAEDTYFYGLRNNGALVELEFKSDPTAWSDRSFVYGTKSPGGLAFCWPTSTNEVRVRLSCSPREGAVPSVVYSALPVPDKGAHPPVGHPYGEEYRKISKIARLGTGKKRGDGVVLTIYVCAKGCSSDVPPNLYEVAKYD